MITEFTSFVIIWVHGCLLKIHSNFEGSL